MSYNTMAMSYERMLIETEKLREWNRQFSERVNKVAELNNLGKEYESKGLVNLAIKAYEANVADGYTATHSFDRLMVIYRKAKDYKNEERIIRRGIVVFKKFTHVVTKYKERLDKLKALQRKASK